MSKLFVSLAAALLLWAAVPMTAVAGGQPVMNVTDAPVNWTTGTPGPAAKVQTAILAALALKGWQGRVVSPGVIQGVLLVRRHRAEIEITFDARKYSIKYVSSEELDYDAAKNTIHRNYNKWIILLQRVIDVEMMRSQG